ncbi:biotin/lipoate A/B protein ligase [Chloroherpeton thalassium ATCC 35110]|uniref:Biotin/lipoate A/B protein ligase n=1 Tax=Chloroherpeton thalassium (strain ATCC 35110 / GB-78) TaxID=517418 RepID=B3QSV6_CHLT3|nr:biotin/lipoate A/B protein ligase family protein [Chloroherpeton thalassium]ACF12599.1 biotin/lipoate A/B protein ligase [Chloroherpeton thalassium ATCC 35110]
MDTWRLIQDDDASAGFGLAADETLARRVGAGTSEPTLRIYTYASHSALVGRFQTVENEVNLPNCAKLGIAVNRRPTGGGAIIMGEGQLGVALTLSAKNQPAYARVKEMMARFSSGILSTFEQLGIDAAFKRKNDIEVNGKKIAGLGLHRTATGGLLFHASILFDLDVALMLEVLKTPFEKITDKEIGTVAERITTVRKEARAPVSIDELRRLVGEGYEKTFETRLREDCFSAEEFLEANVLEKGKYATRDWIFQNSDVPDSAGKAKLKTPGGLLDVAVTLAGKTLKALHLGGDFIASENAIADLEARFRWHSAKSDAVQETLYALYRERETELSHLPIHQVFQAIDAAIENALQKNESEKTEPYGCFVTPKTELGLGGGYAG